MGKVCCFALQERSHVHRSRIACQNTPTHTGKRTSARKSCIATRQWCLSERGHSHLSPAIRKPCDRLLPIAVRSLNALGGIQPKDLCGRAGEDRRLDTCRSGNVRQCGKQGWFKQVQIAWLSAAGKAFLGLVRTFLSRSFCRARSLVRAGCSRGLAVTRSRHPSNRQESLARVVHHRVSWVLSTLFAF